MPVAAAKMDRRLLRVLMRVDDPRLPIAETLRAVGAEAERLGLTRPSYERVRVLVHEVRRRRATRAANRRVLLEVALRARPASAIPQHFSGIGVPPLP